MSSVTLDVASRRERPTISQRVLIWRAFRRHTLATAGLFTILILVVIALLAPALAPYDPAEQDLMNSLMPPSREHLMGTDDLGRDTFSRVLVGSRVSLSVAFVSVAILITIGVLIGVVAGYYRTFDGPLMRVIDLMMSIPNTFLILTIVALFGPGLRNTILVIALTSWMGTARIVRGQFLSLREKEFVEAALAVGASNRRIIFRHIMPNILSVVIVQATLFVAFTVIVESTLSYLGLGVQPPAPSWGNMLSSGRNFIQQAWWMTVFPGLAIFITVLAFNFLGDGLRDALDPRRTERR
ncbi:MAG: ABC transporter permease [Anaerolineae bacterium]